MKLKLNNSGFTLIELLVYAAVFGIILTVVAASVIHGINIRRKGSNYNLVRNEINAITERFFRDVQGSDLSSLVFNSCSSPSDLANPSFTLNLTHVILGPVTYDIVDNEMVRTENGNAGVLSSDDVEVVSMIICNRPDSAPASFQKRYTYSLTVRSKETREQVSISVSSTSTQRIIKDWHVQSFSL